MSILDKAREGQNLLEKIANAIPGFRGYREKELRRDTDRLEREHLASRLEDVKRAFNDVAAAVSRSGNLDAINDVETARKRLDKVANRIRYADRGYAGFFDAVKVDEALLGRVYEFDLSLIEGVNAVRAAAEAARGAADARAGMLGVIAEIDRIDSSLAERESILGGIK
ncbi:MAG: hypothetical protein AB7O37_14870 [Vicinamibacteria bacterium]